MSERSYELRVLSDPGLHGPDGEDVGLPVGKPLAVLCLVALRPPPVQREEVAGVLWPTSSRKRALASLRDALWQLRKATDPELVQSEDEELRVDRERLRVDLDVFDARLKAGRLDDAVELWGEGPFHGFSIPRSRAWSRWTDSVTEDLRRRLGDALLRQAHAALSAGRHESARSAVEGLLQVDPYSERAHLLEIESLLELGRIDAAAQALRRARKVLDSPRRPERLDVLEETIRRRTLRGAPDEHDGGLPIEMVGRSRELARVAGAWRSALSGRPRFVGILGRRGLGKSRLLEEFLLLVDGPDRRVARATGTGTERDIPFSAVAELVRDLHRLPGAAGIAPASDAVLNELVPTLQGDRSGGTPERASESAAVADAFADLVAAVAEEAPLVIVLENFQWIDAESRAALARLPRMVRGRSVLIVAASRSEASEGPAVRELRALEEHGRAEIVELDRLERAQTAELLAFLEADDPRDRDRLADRVHALAGGEPRRIVEQLDFLHDEGAIREDDGAWRLHLDEGTLEALETEFARQRDRSRRYRLVPAAASFGLVAVAGVLVGVPLLSDALTTPTARPAYGGGSLVVVTGQSAVELLPPVAGQPWRTGVAHSLSGLPSGRRPARAPSGELRWFGVVYDTTPPVTGPPRAAELMPDGTAEVIFAGPGDVGFGDLSPDGRHVVLTVEPEDANPYHQNLHRLDLRTGKHERILDFIAYGGGNAEWSADGRLIVRGLNAPGRDSLIVLRPDGERVLALEAPEASVVGSAWCGATGSLLTTTLGEGSGPAIWRLDLDAEAFEAVQTAHPVVGHIAACSPDGTAIAYVAWVDGVRRVVVEPDGGDPHLIAELPGEPEAVVYWEPPARSVPAAVEVRPDRVVLRWGGRDTVRASVEMSIEPAEEIPKVIWSSRDRRVASVDGDGVVYGNSPGRTWAVATVSGWIRDSALVVVEGEPAGDVLLSEPFGAWREEVWRTFGYPEAEIVSLDGERVLSLPGDGVYSDGVISREAFDLHQGGTLEVSFRLGLTRPDRQRIYVCLWEPAPGTVPWPKWALEFEQRVCLRYPARELVDFDAAEAAFTSDQQTTGPYPIPEVPDPESWSSIAIQIRPDGIASAFLNGVGIGTLELPVDNDPGIRWHVRVSGASADSYLYVKDLALWGEMRYPVPEAGR